MSILLQNLRSVTPGVVPATLAPGQLCFNLADEIMFVGDGSNYQTNFDGSQAPTTPGEGWFSVPLNINSLNEYFLINPASYGDLPANGEVLTYSTSLGKPSWAPQVEPPKIVTTTNAAVAASPGTTTSEKITNIFGSAPAESDEVIVAGVPGDVYQGYYLYHSGAWVYAAGYAGPTAAQVPYDNTGSGIPYSNVQGALTYVKTEATTALNIANDALPRAGGTMTGDIVFNNGQPVDAGTY